MADAHSVCVINEYEALVLMQHTQLCMVATVCNIEKINEGQALYLNR